MMMWVRQLTMGEQELIADAVRDQLTTQGYPRDEVDEAVRTAMDSKLSDLDEIRGLWE